MRALVGHTGFVGTNLKRMEVFDDLYNSSNIQEIHGKEYDLVICAAAPASMWAANQNPQADRDNISGIVKHLGKAKIERCVLISTIAVLDDYACGYTESSAKFEVTKAYGANRRVLEIELSKVVNSCSVLRLPALFGEGLKKNFIYDILNPVPSFFDAATFQKILSSLEEDDRDLIRHYFEFQETLGVFRYNRDKAAGNAVDVQVANLMERLNMQSTRLTNSDSVFQYYHLERLWADIERCLKHDLQTLHVATQPISAAEIHLTLTGRSFSNPTPLVHRENMRSENAPLWGGDSNYLYNGEETRNALMRFYNDCKHNA